MRFGRKRDADHLVGDSHLEIQRLRNLRLEPRHILIANMAAILAQMRGDAVGAGFDRSERRSYRVGPRAAARIADGRDMINVDAEAKRQNRHQDGYRSRGNLIRDTLTIDTLNLRDDGLGAQLRDDAVEMLEVIDLEIDGDLGEVRRLPAHVDVIDIAVVLGDHSGKLC